MFALLNVLYRIEHSAHIACVLFYFCKKVIAQWA